MPDRVRPLTTDELAEAAPDAARSENDQHGASRRTVLRAAGLVALAGGGAALAACSAGAEVAAPSASSAAPSAGASSPAASSSPSPSAAASSSAAAPSGPSIATSEVPVGGGVILEDANYVITQPSKGEFKAFSKICTHQGCPVSEIAQDSIICKCHGSKFSIKDGSVTSPPADKPLAEASTTVSGDKVFVQA